MDLFNNITKHPNIFQFKKPKKPQSYNEKYHKCHVRHIWYTFRFEFDTQSFRLDLNSQF